MFFKIWKGCFLTLPTVPLIHCYPTPSPFDLLQIIVQIYTRIVSEFAFVELTQIQNQTNEWIIRGKDIQIA